jgi:hypothetical protein
MNGSRFVELIWENGQPGPVTSITCTICMDESIQTYIYIHIYVCASIVTYTLNYCEYSDLHTILIRILCYTIHAYVGTYCHLQTPQWQHRPRIWCISCSHQLSTSYHGPQIYYDYLSFLRTWCLFSSRVR